MACFDCNDGIHDIISALVPLSSRSCCIWVCASEDDAIDDRDDEVEGRFDDNDECSWVGVCDDSPRFAGRDFGVCER